jgi:hypothetical protein
MAEGLSESCSPSPLIAICVWEMFEKLSGLIR